MRLGAEVGPDEGREGVEDLEGAALDGAVRAGADKLLDGPEREGVLEGREFPPDGAVRDGASRLLEVGLADPEGDVRAGAFKLFDVGRFAEVALFAALCSLRLMPTFGGAVEPAPAGRNPMPIEKAPAGLAMRAPLASELTPLPTAPATREATEVPAGVFGP